MAIFRWPGGWDPFGTVRHMQRELERLMGRGPYAESRRVGGGTYPPINVLDGTDDIVVQGEVAGVKREDMDISITGETLVIKGTKKALENDDASAEGLRYQRRERGGGDFSRTIVLPDRVDPDRVEAALAAGILTIRLPKSEAAKPRQIPVK